MRGLVWCWLLIACQRTAEDPSRRAAACKTDVVKTHGIRGVIFSEACAQTLARSTRIVPEGHAIGYFQPTAAEIEALEKRLRPALELGRKKPETITEMPETPEEREEWFWGVRVALEGILKTYTKFRRQYVGIVVHGGARRVFVNCFPEVEAGGREEYPDWTLRWMDYVDDGAWDYWRIQYDLASGRFFGFEINASA